MIVANLKAHKTFSEVDTWVKTVLGSLPKQALSLPVVAAIPTPHLSGVAQYFVAASPLQLAVQDLSPYPMGAYTGAVAAEMLAGWPVKYAIVGHSERRRYFHETHQDVANKVAQAVRNNITPIVCVDEEYVSAQAAAIEKDLLVKCVVAYEPLEAIGSGQNQPADEVKPVVDKIRQVFGKTKVIYGGSVNTHNIDEYGLVCDGVLVGSASLDAEKFVELVRAAVK